MAKFIVEVYETHGQQYEVDADNKGEAIKKIYNDEGKPINKPEFIMTNEDIGMPTDELDQQSIDIIGNIGDYVPAIRSIEESNPNPFITPNPIQQ